MILGKDVHPQRKIYYLGFLILEIFKNSSEKKLDFFDIYQKINEREKVSMKLFTLTLDWLFLLGTIESDRGYIKKCF